MTMIDLRQGIGVLLLAVALAVAGLPPADANPTPPVDSSAEDGVRSIVLHWFTEMRAGQLDRTQLATEYSAQLSDAAVQEMSRHLDQYGASPIGAQILQSRTSGHQTFYLVKLVFPRGDAASFLFGFDTEGKITGIGVQSMAGD